MCLVSAYLIILLIVSKCFQQRAMQYYWTQSFLFDNMFLARVCCQRRHVASLFMHDVLLFLYSCWVHTGLSFFIRWHSVVAAPAVWEWSCHAGCSEVVLRSGIPIIQT